MMCQPNPAKVCMLVLVLHAQSAAYSTYRSRMRSVYGLSGTLHGEVL
jgi:hypothetical protein